jgi:hypothetical protein
MNIPKNEGVGGVMDSDEVLVQRNGYYTLSFGLSVICLFIGLQKTHPVYAMERTVAYTMQFSLAFLEGTLKLAAKTLWQNPKLLGLIVVLTYYKEIWNAFKDGIGYIVGEFPITSFAASLFALWYISELYTSQDKT